MWRNWVHLQNDSETAQRSLSSLPPVLLFSEFVLELKGTIFEVMVMVVGSWWGLKPECVISAASYHSSQRGASLLICLLTLLLPLAPRAQSSQPVLHVEYTLVYCSSFGNFTSSLRFVVPGYLVKVFPICFQNIRVENSRWVPHNQRLLLLP